MRVRMLTMTFVARLESIEGTITVISPDRVEGRGLAVEVARGVYGPDVHVDEFPAHVVVGKFVGSGLDLDEVRAELPTPPDGAAWKLGLEGDLVALGLNYADGRIGFYDRIAPQKGEIIRKAEYYVAKALERSRGGQ